VPLPLPQLLPLPLPLLLLPSELLRLSDRVLLLVLLCAVLSFSALHTRSFGSSSSRPERCSCWTHAATGTGHCWLACAMTTDPSNTQSACTGTSTLTALSDCADTAGLLCPNASRLSWPLLLLLLLLLLPPPAVLLLGVVLLGVVCKRSSNTLQHAAARW
jgi:hypothetical protein